MAERQTAMTPAHKQRRGRLTKPQFWRGNSIGALQRIADDVDRIFDGFGLGRRLLGSTWGEVDADLWAPEVDVFQKNNELTIRADLPGLKREDVSVDIRDDAVTIQGERERATEQEQQGYYRRERSYGTFCRVIPLPDGAITEQAKANFFDGVLEITMPAPPTSKGRRLEIAEGAKK